MSATRLTAKQAAFVREYLVDLNATGAARRAGYSERTASEVGYENLRKPQISEAIENALAERANRTELTADEVIEGLKREASFTGEGSSHSARVQALSWLGRHLAMFTDKSQVEVKGLADRIAQTYLRQEGHTPRLFATERYQKVVATAGAAGASEAMRQNTATQIGPEVALDPRGDAVRRGIRLGGLCEEGLESDSDPIGQEI